MTAGLCVLAGRSHTAAGALPEYVLCAQAGKPFVNGWVWSRVRGRRARGGVRPLLARSALPQDTPAVASPLKETMRALAYAAGGAFCIGGGADGKLYVWEVSLQRRGGVHARVAAAAPCVRR